MKGKKKRRIQKCIQVKENRRFDPSVHFSPWKRRAWNFTCLCPGKSVSSTAESYSTGYCTEPISTLEAKISQSDHQYKSFCSTTAGLRTESPGYWLQAFKAFCIWVDPIIDLLHLLLASYCSQKIPPDKSTT